MIEPEKVELTTPTGTRLCAYDHGGSGTDVLFLHATGMHGRMWDPVVAGLEGARAVAIDAPGHGRSSCPGGDGVDGVCGEMDWAAMAADVAAMVDHLGLDGTTVAVGHSMGGCLAMLVELERPGTFTSAWLFEPILVPRDAKDFGSGDNPLAAAARRRRETFVSRDEAYERYMAKPPFAGCDGDSVRAYVDHGFVDVGDGVRLRCRGETEARTFEGARTDVFDRLGAVRIPVTLVSGGDGGPPAQVAEQAAEAIPDARLLRWPDLSHFGPLEDPVRIARSVRETL